MAKKPASSRVPAGEREARELRILNAIAEALNSAPDVEEALTRTLDQVTELLGLQTGWIWLLDPETRHFYSAAVRNLPPYLQEPVRMAGHDCWCIDMFRDGELGPTNIDVMACSRLQAAERIKQGELTQGLSYHASIPLYFQDKPLGIMNVTGPSWRKLTQAELRLLSTIAYQVGIAVERARLAEDAARLARAEERTRLAREIHDTLAQGLTAIVLHLESAQHHVGSDPQRVSARLEQALNMARESLEEARRSVLDLRAEALAGKPLAEALAALARSFTSERGIRAHVHVAGEQALSLRVEAELFRIAQEALTNVRKHARAQQATIELRFGQGAVTLIVRDDGRGFQPARASSGHGLVGMRERARLLGGKLRVSSRPGHGTSISAIVPLEDTE